MQVFVKDSVQQGKKNTFQLLLESPDHCGAICLIFLWSSFLTSQAKCERIMVFRYAYILALLHIKNTVRKISIYRPKWFLISKHKMCTYNVDNVAIKSLSLETWSCRVLQQRVQTGFQASQLAHAFLLVFPTYFLLKLSILSFCHINILCIYFVKC